MLNGYLSLAAIYIPLSNWYCSNYISTGISLSDELCQCAVTMQTELVCCRSMSYIVFDLVVLVRFPKHDQNHNCSIINNRCLAGLGV